MHNNNINNLRLKFLVDVAYWAMIFAIAYLLFKYCLNQLMPLVLAFVFAAIVRPISKLLSSETRLIRDKNGNKISVRRRLIINRKAAAIISVIILFVVLLGIVVFIAVRMTVSISSAFSEIPRWYYETFVPEATAILNNLEIYAAKLDPVLRDTFKDAIPNLISTLGSTVTNFSGKAVSWIAGFASGLPSALLNAVICLIATVFFAVDFDRIKSFIKNNVKEKNFELMIEVRDSFLEMIWSFIKSYFIIFCITFAEISVGLLIMGRSNPFLFGILIAIFDAFPIVGSGMILLPWAIILMITESAWGGIGMLVLYAVVVVARQIIEPKIVGKQVGLRPVVSLACMVIGTKLFGGIGLFGMPICAAIIADLNSNGIIHFFNYPDNDYLNEG